MLLPSLSVAREKAKRSVCFGNLKQIYMGAMSYNDDFDNEVPIHLDAGAVDGSLGTEDSIYGTNVNPYTGWRSYGEAKYMPLSLFECPSMGIKPDYRNTWGIHYSYRYNSERVVKYGGEGALFKVGTTDNYVLPRGTLVDPKRNDKALFTDALRMRRDKNVKAVIVTKNIDYYQRRWSHEEGGQVLKHDGSAQWLYNQSVYFPGHWYGDAIWTRLDGFIK